MTYKKRIVILSIVVILMGLLVVGGTYAYLNYTVSVTNANYVGNTACFLINYNITNDDGTLPINGTLFPSNGHLGGLSGKVSISSDASCTMPAVGSLYLNVNSSSDVLLQTVSSHCEESDTLKSMIDYTTEEECASQNGTWVTSGTALKYAVYGETDEPIKVGYIDSTGVIDLYDEFSITTTVLNYYVYIWLDGNISDNSYANASFDGYVYAQALQLD